MTERLTTAVTIVGGSTPLSQYIPPETIPLLSYPILQFGIVTVSVGEILSIVGIIGMAWGIRATIKKTNKESA